MNPHTHLPTEQRLRGQVPSASGSRLACPPAGRLQRSHRGPAAADARHAHDGA